MSSREPRKWILPVKWVSHLGEASGGREKRKQRKVQVRLFQGRCGRRQESFLAPLKERSLLQDSPWHQREWGSGKGGFTPPARGPAPLPLTCQPPAALRKLGAGKTPKQPGFPFSGLWGEEMLGAEGSELIRRPRDPPRGAREATAR